MTSSYLSNWNWYNNNSSSFCLCSITVDLGDHLFKIVQKPDEIDLKSIMFFSCVFNINLWHWHPRGAVVATDSWQFEVCAISIGVQQGASFPFSFPGKEMVSPVSQGSLPKSAASPHDAVLVTRHVHEMRPPATPSLPYLMTVHIFLYPSIIQPLQQWRKPVVPLSWTKPHKISFTSQSPKTLSDVIYLFLSMYFILPVTVVFTIYYVHLK